MALVFHWPPSEMDLLSLDDLMLFREEARIRHQPPERT
nr:GpE family phage tail protein [Vibrio litoralis]